MKKIYFMIKLLTFGFILPLIYISCSSKADEVPSGNSSGAFVQVSNPVRTNLTQFSNLNATTVFIKKETVRSTIQGFIKKSMVSIGDFVKPGKELFVIKTRESSATDSGGVMIGKNLFTGEVIIHSHSSGVVTGLMYNEGDYVAESEQLALISVPSSLRLHLDVPFQFVSKINHKTRYSVILPDGKTVYANIENIVPIVDRATQTQKLILYFVNNVSLPESLNVNVLFPVNQVNDALAAPKSAVMSNETMDMFWVMKLINDSTAVRYEIKKGIETDSLLELKNSGLNITDEIVVTGAYGLPDSARVRVVK